MVNLFIVVRFNYYEATRVLYVRKIKTKITPQSMTRVHESIAKLAYPRIVWMSEKDEKEKSNVSNFKKCKINKI